MVPDVDSNLACSMNANALLLAALFCLLLQLCSCAQKSPSAADLHADVTTALSVAADADTSLALFREGHLSSAFFKGHIQNLSQQAQRTSKEIGTATPADGHIVSQLREFRRDLSSLLAALTLAEQNVGNAKSLADANSQIATTRNALELLHRPK